MEALERLARLLVQQHGMAQTNGGERAAGAHGGPSTSPTPAPAAAFNTWRGPFDSAANGGTPKNGSSGPAAAGEATGISCGELPLSATGMSGEQGQVSSLTAALASLLNQRAAEADALLPGSLDAMSRDSSREYASAAAAAVAAAAGEAEDPSARGRQLELAKAIAQVIITHLQRHPNCMALKQMGAALSETLLKCVTPGGPSAAQQAQQAQQAHAQQQQAAQQQAQAQQQVQQAAQQVQQAQQAAQQHMLLAALLQQQGSLPPGGGSSFLDLCPDTIRSSTGSASADVLLAAALGQSLQVGRQWSLPSPLSHEAQQGLFRPQALRPSAGGTTDQGGDRLALGLIGTLPHSAPAIQSEEPPIKRVRMEVAHGQRSPFEAAQAISEPPHRSAEGRRSSNSGVAAGAVPAGGTDSSGQPAPLVPLLQGAPGSPRAAAAGAAAAAAAASAALRPLAAREQAIPRQAPAQLRRSVLSASLGHPQAAVDRLLTNATYMSRLHVNQSMAHDLLPDVEESLQPKDAQRQGSGASVNLFKHSIVVVDEQDRAWPVQYEGFMSAGQRHLRLGAGWRYMCRANNAAVGDTMVLERWTQDRSVVHVRILRSAPAAQLPILGDLPVLPSLPLPGSSPGLAPVTALPPALQAMLGVAAEAAAAEALKNDTTLPPLPTLSLLPELEPQQPEQPKQEQPSQQRRSPQRRQQQQQRSPQRQRQSPQPSAAPVAAVGAASPFAAAAAGAPSTTTSSQLGTSGGNCASGLSEPMPPATTEDADEAMQGPVSDAGAGI